MLASPFIAAGLSSLIAVPALAADEHVLPPGFAVERAADRAASYIALAFDPAGRALAALEEGGLVWFADADADGFFETTGTFSDDIAGVQGLCWLGDEMFVSGSVGDRSGLWRVDVAPDGLSAESFTLLAEVRPTGAPSQEHGAHALVPGPDGGLFWVLGDHVEVVGTPDPSAPRLTGYAGSVLPVLEDPLGQGAGVRYPAGHVVRVDPASGAWWVHSTGLRNAYDLAFDRDGELFTFDSDMEWDVGLPWYRPVRFLHLVPGGEYGWRRGSGPWPPYYLDGLPPLAEVGRASPTGLALCTSGSFPPRLEGALLAGDWSNGRILALFPEPAGASFSGRVETLVQAAGGLSITDMAFGPDGALYFVGGGRGTLGRLERLVYRGPLPSAEQRRLGRPSRSGTWLSADPAPRVIELGDPDPVLRRRACEALAFAPALPEGASESLCHLLDDRDRWVRFAARRALERHGQICAPASDPLSVGAHERTLMRLSPELPPSLPYLPTLGDLGPDDSPERWLAALRVFGLLLLQRPEAAGADELERVGAALLSTFPHPDARVAREQAALLARLQVPDALEAFVARLDLEPERTQRLHFARCAAAIEDGWTAALARPTLALLEQALTWKGGASYGGYLERLRDDVSANFSAQQRVSMARDVRGPAPLGPRTLAAWMRVAEPELVEQLMGPLQYAWGRMPERLEPADLRRERASVLAALPRTRAPGLAEFLRRQCDNPEAPRAEALAALARIGLPADFPRFVDGLSLAEPLVREECARALSRIDRAPEAAAPFRTALTLAERLGAERGALFLDLFVRWTEEPAGPADWNASLRHWERWGVERFTGFAADVDDSRRPAWDFDAQLSFLTRSAARPGSAERGAAVFEQATCATCHVLGDVGGSDAGWGPDLTGATRRFDRRTLLEALVFPSRVISDQHVTVIVETAKGDLHTGRLLEDSDEHVLLLERGGERRTIPRAEVADVWPSDVSAMPEGLLTALTLEQLKDLLAFLDADGATEPDASPPWFWLFDDAHRNLWEGEVSLWKLRGGGLVGRTRGLDQSAYFYSKLAWSDFELEFDVRLKDGAGNSGVQYRARAQEGDPDGYQADIGAQFWGSLFAGDGRGTLARPDETLWRDAVRPSGWNHFHLRVEGDRHTLEVNGVRLVDARDDAFRDGLLAFQLHAGGTMEVRFQNARLRPLR